MRGTTHASLDDIHITGIWGTLRRSGTSLLLAAMVAGGLTYTVLSIAPKYMSEAQLTPAVNNACNSFAGCARGSGIDGLADPAAANTPVRASKSPGLARSGVGDLKLATMLQFNSALASTDSIGSLPRALGPSWLTALVSLAALLSGTAWAITRALISRARAHAHDIQPKRRASDRERPASALPSDEAIGSVSPSDVVRHLPSPVNRDPDRSSWEDRVDCAGVAEIASVPRLARHIRAYAPNSGGLRTLITSSASTIDPSVEGLSLAEEFAADGQQTIVIDWSLDETGFCRSIGLGATPGFNDLAHGDATFEDVIHSLSGSQIHVMPCGTSLGGKTVDQVLDCEKLNLLLDALDEAYDQIIVVAKPADARALFEAIEGRFDAAVTVSIGSRSTARPQDPPDTFLGFEVTGITLIRFHRISENSARAQSFVHPGWTAGAEARI